MALVIFDSADRDRIRKKMGKVAARALLTAPPEHAPGVTEHSYKNTKRLGNTHWEIIEQTLTFFMIFFVRHDA